MSKLNSSGLSLVEVLIGVGILGIMAIALSTVIVNQHHAMKQLTQKQEILELKNLLLQQAANPDICTWQLQNKVIDVSMVTSASNPSPTVINLGTLYQGLDAGSAPLATAGSPLPLTQTGLVVSAVEFMNIYATGVPNEYVGEFRIVFDPTSLHLPLQPLQLAQRLSTLPGDPPNAKRIASCISQRDVQVVDVIDTSVTSCGGVEDGCNLNATCPVGYTLTSCWNEEDGGSSMVIVRKTDPTGQDQCRCISSCPNPSDCKCWSAQAVCTR